jgi:hypothetical protein
VKGRLSEANQLVTSPTKEVASIVVDVQKSDDASVCSSILTFDTPTTGSQHGSLCQGYPSSQSSTRNTNGWYGDDEDCDQDLLLLIDYVVDANLTFQSPYRPRRR